jgi:pyruvate dehydrogenase E1 component alpha subunit
MTTLGTPLDMFDHLYAEIPPSLARQRTELADELDHNDEEVRHG